MIACLGWGSLIWDPRDLPICSEWSAHGPALPVEFARQSANGRMTLLIAEDTEAIPVLWAALDVDSLDAARQALARREGITSANMDSSIGVWSSGFSCGYNENGNIAAWGAATGVSGVVWTALRPKFADRPIKPSCHQVLMYLANLEGQRKRIAEEYVRNAPAQIRTPYRQRIERELGWTTRHGG